MADISAAIMGPDFREDTRYKHDKNSKPRCLCVSGLPPMEAETPVDFLERLMLNFRVAIGSFATDDFTLPKEAEISIEDAEYLAQLQHIVKSYPEQEWLVAKLKQFVVTGQTICKKLKEATSVLDEHMLDAAKTGEYNIRRLLLLRDNILLINEMARYVDATHH